MAPVSRFIYSLELYINIQTTSLTTATVNIIFFSDNISITENELTIVERLSLISLRNPNATQVCVWVEALKSLSLEALPQRSYPETLHIKPAARLER